VKRVRRKGGTKRKLEKLRIRVGAGERSVPNKGKGIHVDSGRRVSFIRGASSAIMGEERNGLKK